MTVEEKKKKKKKKKRRRRKKKKKKKQDQFRDCYKKWSLSPDYVLWLSKRCYGYSSSKFVYINNLQIILEIIRKTGQKLDKCYLTT